MTAPAELRTRLVENGYSCTPNVGKACFLPGWPKVEATPGTIERWSRRHKRFQDTGIRVQDGLAVIDIDVNHPLADELLAAIEARWPNTLYALVRYGKGHKYAIFCRTTEPFGRLHSFRFWAPGRNNPDKDEAHCVEIFGGASPRQFGAFGAHTRSDNGEVLVEYRWADGLSPLDVRLDELPEFSKADFFAMLDLVSGLLREAGFEQVLRSTSRENKGATRVYDLTDDMQFECNDGFTRTLAQLRELAGYPGLRCSASWLELGRNHSPTRCLIGRSRHGAMTLYDTATEITHMPADAAPHEVVQRVADLTAAARAKLQKMQETCRD